MNNKIVSPYSNEVNNLRNYQNINPNNENNNIIEANINNRIKQVSIKYSCCTPYFQFGKTIFFYFPNSLKDLKITDIYYTNTYDLSQMPDPPFSIGYKCKFFFSYFYR